jgi:PAS domain S-box-containing protein
VKRLDDSLENLLRDLDAIVWEADAEAFVFTYVSDAATRITGYPPELWRTPGFWEEHIHPEDRGQAVGTCSAATRDGRDHEFEYRFRTAGGDHLWVRDIVHVVKDGAGRPVRLRGVIVDVTGQRLARNARQQSEDRLRNLLENLQVGVSVYGPGFELLLHNPAACELLGMTESELAGQSLVDPRWNVIREDGTPFPASEFPAVRALETGRTIRNVVMGVHRPRTGDRVWILVNASPELDADGRVRRVVASFGDITEARQAGMRVRLLEQAISRLNDVVLITEPEPLEEPGPRVLYVNDAFETVTGYSRDEMLGRPLYTLFGPETDRGVVGRMVAELRAQRPTSGEIVLPFKSGGEYRVESSAVPITNEQGRTDHLVIISRDVTERRRLEEQLEHSRKLEAVGMLAGGIAHDFNNLLTAMLGYTELLLGRIAPGAPHRREVEEVHRASERAAALTRQLLAFSRKQMLRPRVIDLNALVLNLDGMLHRLLGEEIEVRTCLDPALGRVRADPSQLEQVIVNLAVNARDAMPDGGKLLLSTERAPGEGGSPGAEGEPATCHALLRVEDTGAGMDAATRAQIFDPFFTTKDVGRGTGLGLSTVYGIVKQSGGSIQVESEPGKGTRFTIQLPCVDGATAAEPEPVDAAVGTTGTETILLVEDEPSVRVLARESLRECGYTVLEAADGEEALRVAAGCPGPIHLLLTDVVMPRMRGRALADRLREARPGTGVLFISGYPDDARGRRGDVDPGSPFLEKPFTPDTLLRRVRQTLDEAGRPPGASGAAPRPSAGR